VSNESLILASASPRRRELLLEMGVPFEVATAEVRELDAESSPHLSAIEIAQENAGQKARAIARSVRGAGRWVLGADTIVLLNDRLYGKPASLDEAKEFLRTLSGQTHEVITACVLLNPDRAETVLNDITRVTFRVLSDEIISRYLTAVNVLDKAGAYALQEHGDWIVERVEGSRRNVIGLPTEALRKIFVRCGLL
jgi:septum formation protein